MASFEAKFIYNIYETTWQQWISVVNRKKIDSFDVNPIGENSSHEYILEVDLKYPDKLHDNNYPA